MVKNCVFSDQHKNRYYINIKLNLNQISISKTNTLFESSKGYSFNQLKSSCLVNSNTCYWKSVVLQLKNVHTQG